jgi:hypothetical protein
MRSLWSCPIARRYPGRASATCRTTSMLNGRGRRTSSRSTAPRTLPSRVSQIGDERQLVSRVETKKGDSRESPFLIFDVLMKP